MGLRWSLQSRLSAVAGTPVVAMSNATATGGIDDALVELDEHEDTGLSQEETEAIEKGLEEDEQDVELKEKRKVHFKDHDLTSEFDDSNLWARGKSAWSLTGPCHAINPVSFLATDPNESAQDMILAYQRECLGLKVKPIQNLLDQLKVSGRADGAFGCT